jgi:hypothetical protein
MWLLTSVESDYGIEILNRLLALDISTTPEHKDDIIALMKRDAEKGNDPLPVDDEVLVCREIIRQLKTKLFKVVVPYTERIEWRDIEGIRNFGIFLDIIKAIAVLRHMQRNVVDGVLEATEADFDEAKTLYKSISVKQTTKLTETEQKIALLIFNGRGTATITSISQRLQIPPERVRTIIEGKRGDKDRHGGMMGKIPGLEAEKVTERNPEENQSRQRIYYSLTDYKPLGAFIDVVELLPPGQVAKQLQNGAGLA